MKRFIVEDKARFRTLIATLTPAEQDTPAELAEAWERRRIDKRDDLRQISILLLKSPKEFMSFRAGEDLETVYSRSVLSELEEKAERDENIPDKLFRYLGETKKLLENTPFAVLSSVELREKLFVRLDEIAAVHQSLKKMQ